MGVDDEFTQTDRVLTIGVLATLSGYFLVGGQQRADHLMDRYRRDLSASLGHTASDEECHDALESQVTRLRLSIGERW